MPESTTRDVDRLIRIVSGGQHHPAVIGRRHWFSPFRTVLQSERWDFDLDDQLQAIEALGSSGNESVLRFLRQLATPISQTEYREVLAYGQGSGDCNPYNVSVQDSETVTFPNAKGPLAASLKYSIPLGGQWSSEMEVCDSDEVIEQRRSEVLAASRSHTALATAIRQLEKPRATGSGNDRDA